MPDFKRGDRVRALDPATYEELDACFLGIADPWDTLEISLESGSAATVAAWIELDDGTTRKVVYHQLRPAYWRARAAVSRV